MVSCLCCLYLISFVIISSIKFINLLFADKIVILCLFGFLSCSLFIWSLFVDYKWMLALEHIRFRSGFPSQANWITSPYGTLNCYLFNVTNSEAFLRGDDKKLKLQEVGPIVYRVEGRNQVLNQTDNSLTYRKIRYNHVKFDAEASCAPDILNQTIVLPNFILLGAASKFHALASLVFNAMTISEPVFFKRSVYYFLWDFTTPSLDVLSIFLPDIVSNCGMLHNALRVKKEIYNVQIGVENGMKNFFRVNTLNNKTSFPEQKSRLEYLNKTKYGDLYCPIDVSQAYDNSIFPPYMTLKSPMPIVAAEACRTLELKYNRSVEHLGFSAYEYTITDDPSIKTCLDDAMGIKLHDRMFDVSKCLFNDVPAAFSSPHFYGSSYNWSEHFEGLSPTRDLHEASIVIEPITGIPIEEKYRFQSNIPMPDMTYYSQNLQKFSNMVVPTFWYEYDLDDLPWIVLLLMRLNIFGIPILQRIFTVIFMLFSIFCFLKCFLLYKKITFKVFFKLYIIEKLSKKSLETTFENSFKDKDIEISKI